MVESPTGSANRSFPVWAMLVISLSSGFALVAWLAALGVWIIAAGPSGSPDENMNGMVILLLPEILAVAFALTGVALLVGAINARSKVTKTVTSVFGVLTFVVPLVAVMVFLR